MSASVASQSVYALPAFFLLAASFELVRERYGRLHISRLFPLIVVAMAFIGALIQQSGGEQVVTAALVEKGSAYISLLPYGNSWISSVLSTGVLFAAILFCPSAPLVRLRMSRVFALQALLHCLMYVQRIEWFLFVAMILTGGIIIAVRRRTRALIGDELRFLRARTFTVYQGVAIACMCVSLLLRILATSGTVPPSSGLWNLDVASLCIASAISIGLFPFHGWVLPFLSSPRATIFLPMFCIQVGLLFFLRVYMPIVSEYYEHSVFFVAVPVVGILYAALLFFGEYRLKRIPGNLYLSHVCLMAIGVAGLGDSTNTSVMLDGVNTLVATLGLLGVCALLTSRFGIRGVLVPTGLGSFFPELAVCYLVCVLSLVGFPGTLGFIEEEVLMGHAVGHHNLLVAAIAIALTLNGFSSFRLFARVFMGQPMLGQDSETSILLRERLVLYLIIGVIIFNGLMPSFILNSLGALGH